MRVLGTALGEAQRGVRNGFAVGGVCVRVSGEREADVTLVPLLKPFQIQANIPDIDIRVEWVSSVLPSRGLGIFDSGTTWRAFKTNSEIIFDFHSEKISFHPYKRLLIDEEFQNATLQMNEEYFAGLSCIPEPLGYPLDELLIMHRLTQEKAIELHGCGIVTADGIGNLFVGHSGAGKSTTTRLWTASEDVEILSDDRIIVRRDERQPDDDDKDASQARPFDRWRSLRAGSDNRAARPGPSLGKKRLAPDDKTIRMYGTPWHGEAMFASPNSAELTRIMVLEHGHGNVLTRLSPSQAVAELFVRSFVPMHRHEYVESALAFLEEVADSVPCYRYSFEPDRDAVDTILNLRD